MTMTTGHVVHPSGNRKSVHWACLEAPAAKGIVVIPPLIGAGAAYQLKIFRWLTRQGLDLLSFDYSGHGRSGGQFSLNGSLEDTCLVMKMGRARARERAVPLFGIGT